MNNVTLEIILLSKKSYKRYPEGRAVDRIIHYLRDENICEKEHYRDFHYVLTRYIRNIMYDYIDTCDKPSDVLKSIENIKRLDYGNMLEYRHISELDYILKAFMLIAVKSSNGEYVNGFNKKAIEDSILKFGGEA